MERVGREQLPTSPFAFQNNGKEADVVLNRSRHGIFSSFVKEDLGRASASCFVQVCSGNLRARPVSAGLGSVILPA